MNGHLVPDAPTDEPDASPGGFGDELFLALVAMAERSYRSQADVHAAMNSVRLAPVPPEHVARSLGDLERGGFVEDVLHLSDGGILVRVTPAGKARARTLMTRRRTPVPPHPEAR